jgi:hypothetical protein
VKPASAKAKGRALQNQVAELLREAFDLADEDVKPAIMGEQGEDIHLSAFAREKIGLSIECKNQERLNIWDALKQAEANAPDDLDPVVVFKRNRSSTYVALDFTAFVYMVQALSSLKGLAMTPSGEYVHS